MYTAPTTDATPNTAPTFAPAGLPDDLWADLAVIPAYADDAAAAAFDLDLQWAEGMAALDREAEALEAIAADQAELEAATLASLVAAAEATAVARAERDAADAAEYLAENLPAGIDFSLFTHNRVERMNGRMRTTSGYWIADATIDGTMQTGGGYGAMVAAEMLMNNVRAARVA